MKKVSVIIVNTNTKDALKLCLENLKGKYENLEIIVNDTCSYDGSADMVEKDFPNVKLIRGPNNGLSYGLNRALEQATGDYYLYLGSDAFPEKDTIPGLVDYMEKHPDVGGAVAKLLLRDGTQDMDGHRGFSTPWASFTHFVKLGKLFPKSKLFGQYFLTYKDLSTEHEIDSTITHFLFMSKTAQDKVGKWDEENFFLYGEDIDFCYRLKEAGFKLMYLPQFKAQHWKGVTIGIRKSSKDVATQASTFNFRGKDMSKKELRVLVQKLSTQSMETFYNKHYRKIYPWPLTLLIITTIRTFSFLRTTKQRIVNYLDKQ